MIRTKFQQLIKAGFNQAGFDIFRSNKSPAQTLLGLRSRPISTVIDVGANTGQFARNISRFFPRSKLYCFEPVPEPFDVLSSWAKTQNGRAVTFNLALSEKEGDVEMFLHEDHSPSSSLLATTNLTAEYYPFTKRQKNITVRQTTLDAALGSVHSDLSSEILIKLDVQGYEARVIAGGTKTFSKASVCIMEVSLDTLYEGQADFKELIMMLDALDYRYMGNLDQTYGKDGHCVFLDAVFMHKSI